MNGEELLRCTTGRQSYVPGRVSPPHRGGARVGLARVICFGGHPEKRAAASAVLRLTVEVMSWRRCAAGDAAGEAVQRKAGAVREERAAAGEGHA